MLDISSSRPAWDCHLPGHGQVGSSIVNREEVGIFQMANCFPDIDGAKSGKCNNFAGGDGRYPFRFNPFRPNCLI